MSLIGFEPAISARKRPKSHALDRAATVTGKYDFNKFERANQHLLITSTCKNFEERKDLSVSQFLQLTLMIEPSILCRKLPDILILSW